MKEQTKILIIELIIAIGVLFIVAYATIIVLEQFAPFSQCEDRNLSDDDIIKLPNGEEVTCGELRAVNTTIATT